MTNEFKFSTIQGREILQITNMKVDFSVSSMRLHLSNLFNGNKVLGEKNYFENLQQNFFSNPLNSVFFFFAFVFCISGQTVNQFLNKNALLVVDELKEDIGEALSVVFIEILNNAFRHMPTDLWLLNE